MSESDDQTPGSYEKARSNGKLVRESEWMRVYELGPKYLRYGSKFLSDEVQMSAHSFATRWPSMSRRERWEFVFAYHAKGDFTSEDERIVDMIMHDGDDHIWSSIALFMLRHPEQTRVLGFLRSRLEAKTEHPWNYIQALGEAKDTAAVPILRSYFDQFRVAAETERLAGVSLEPPDGPGPSWGFLICCKALWNITALDEYENVLRTYLNHPNARIRGMARRSL